MHMKDMNRSNIPLYDRRRALDTAGYWICLVDSSYKYWMGMQEALEQANKTRKLTCEESKKRI